jgi:hypothetical protein
MKKNTFLILILSLLVFVFLFGELSVFSQGLETEYPMIDQYRPVSSDAGEFPQYLMYIIRFLTISAGVVAFGALTYGGFLWMTSEGEPIKLQKSKNRIISSIVGLLLILVSYIFLGSINPTLVTLEKIEATPVDDIWSPGVYLSLSGSFHENEPEKIRENVRKITSSERGLGNLGGQIKAIRIVNPTEDNREGSPMVYRYIVVLHGEESFRGPCHFILTNSNAHNFTNISSNILENTFSISVTRAEKHNQTPYGRVVVYDKPEFQEGSSWQRLFPTTTESFTPLEVEPWSIDIEGDYGVILASGSNWNQMSDSCALFATSRPITSLIDHYMNRCSPYVFSSFFAAYRSCATHYALFPLYKR